MNLSDKEKSFWSRASNLIVVFVVLAAIMISSALFELSQSKSEQLDLMHEHAHSLLKSILTASNNSLLASEELENNYKTRLLKSAAIVKDYFESGRVSNRWLEQFSRQNDIYRINIFDRSGKRIYNNHERDHFDLTERFSPQDVLRPIFSGMRDSIVFGVRRARFEDSFRFAVAVAARNRSAIVLNIDAQPIIDFRRKMGFGILLRKVSENKSIIYLALQDTNAIMAAAGQVSQLEPIQQVPFLQKALQENAFQSRTIQKDSLDIFEAVHPFVHHERVVGLFRLGLSMEPIRVINDRVYRRLIVITMFLIVLGTIFLTVFFTRQKYHLLRRRYDIVETYSGNVIQNVSDAIIVTHAQKGIDIFNEAAEMLFHKKQDDVKGRPISVLFVEPQCSEIIAMESGMRSFECNFNREKKYLLISKNIIQDSENNENTIYVIHDLTHQKALEEQVQRTARLSAMGELASGVAHEIRNPLNAIGTIVQQLDKDFEPENDQQEYHELAGLVYNEVKRINETVQDFLRFARPEPVQPQWFILGDLINELQKQYKSVAEQKNIAFSIDLKTDKAQKVLWDKRQIKQVFINIIQNAIDAIEHDGEIIVSVESVNNNELEITLKDDGPGIKKEVRDHIFNLYFTTKAQGTGVGLSIVQRIIYEHGGSIRVESEDGTGSSFIIRMPLKAE